MMLRLKPYQPILESISGAHTRQRAAPQVWLRSRIGDRKLAVVASHGTPRNDHSDIQLTVDLVISGMHPYHPISGYELDSTC